MTISDDSSDDDEYSEVYKLIGKESDPKKKTHKLDNKPQQQEPIIPGQKMALNRTILPNGARVGEKQNVRVFF